MHERIEEMAIAMTLEQGKPFGGAKDSGFGREGGTKGLQCYTVVKTVSHLTA